MIIAGTFPKRRTARPERRSDEDGARSGDLPPDVPGPRNGDSPQVPTTVDETRVQPTSPSKSEPVPNL
jgi:hypothetical protein